MYRRCHVGAFAHPDVKDPRGGVRRYHLHHRRVSISHHLLFISCLKPSHSSQLYFAWQVYMVSQKHFVKYVASGAVVVLSLVAFGKCAAQEEILSTDVHLFASTAGGLGKSEIPLGLRLPRI